VAQTGVDRIELYTEEFASNYQTENQDKVLEKYRQAAQLAQQLGLGVNAGHDLDSHNLATFLQINNILEVSIGHVLTIECIEQGMPTVVKKYLDICNHA
jgi:pyridoxine 5-phosphate synthase